jgi:hypothetical protein
VLLSALTLALALRAGDPAALPAARAELSRVAERIELLKARRVEGRDVGRELERLLVRAQELAAEIDRRAAAVPPPPGVAPSVEELRERADALHDEADRLAASLTELDLRIASLRRATAPAGAGLSVAAVRGGSGRRAGPAVAPADEHRLHTLLRDRDALAARLAAVRADAAAIEAEAAAAER